MVEYALLGNPLSHSKSAEFFNSKFKNEKIDAYYINMELERLSMLPLFLRLHKNLRGFNVTSPYKEEIISRLTAVDREAELIRSVNTVVVKRGRLGQRKLIGYNTDIEGFYQSIKPLLLPSHKSALILGTGGGARAVERAFKKLGIPSQLVSRNPSSSEIISYTEIDDELIKSNKIIVNATILGMAKYSLSAPPIPYEALDASHLCYDLIYSPEQTKFLSLSQKQGATTKNGLDMLMIQAIEAWNIWQQFL